jgi:hypothetical protein
LTLTEGSIQAGKESVTVEGQVQRATDTGVVPVGGRDIDPLIYKALVNLSSEMHVGGPVPAAATSAAPGAGRKRPTPAEQQQADEALLQERRGRVEALGGTIQKSLGSIQAAYFRAKLVRAKGVLPQLTIGTAPNKFGALSETFFVDQRNNNYIVPVSAVSDVKVDEESLRIGTDPKVSSRFAYGGKGNALNTAQLKGILLTIGGQPGGLSPGETQLTMFLAAMVAEPSRYSVAHITNLLAVGSPAPPPGSAFKQLSMTQGGSDPQPGEKVEPDPRLAGIHPDRNMPKKVTDRDLAIVKGRKDLMDQIDKVNVPGASPETLVVEITRILRGAIHDLENAHKSGAE